VPALFDIFPRRSLSLEVVDFECKLDMRLIVMIEEMFMHCGDDLEELAGRRWVTGGIYEHPNVVAWRFPLGVGLERFPI
jgi:hypothetical protein